MTPDEDLPPAERRLVEHLEIVKAAPPAAGVSLVRAVVRSARLQRALREPLRLVGTIASAVVDGLTALFAGSRRRSP